MNHRKVLRQSDRRNGHASFYMIEFKNGPDRQGPKYCLHCHRPFLLGEPWQLSWDPEHVYAVGTHNRCIFESRDKHAARKGQSKNRRS